MLCAANVVAQASNPCELTQCTLMDKKPRVIKAFPPHLTGEAKKSKVSGMVVVRCVITKEGKTSNASVVESEPAGFYDESVLEAVKAYKFSPALRDGEPIDVCIELPIKIDRKK